MSSPPEIFDSHCHLDDPELAPVLEEVLLRARRAGLAGAIIAGYGPERWKRQTELLLRTSDFRLAGAFGIHPWALDGRLNALQYEALLNDGWTDHACRWGNRLVAIGEFGLDRVVGRRDKTWELQQEVFRTHLRWADRLRLPVILHLVRADGAAMDLLRECSPSRGGVVHAFSSHPQTMPAFAELGLSFSFGSGLLRLEKARAALAAAPLDRVLFETDAPQPLKRSFPPPWGPHHLVRIVETASQVLGKSVEYLLARHRENCARLFELGPITEQPA